MRPAPKPALVSPLRALMQRVRSRIISAPRLSPEVWCAPLGPSGPAASHWLDNSQIQRLDPEKSPENHRRATNITEVASTKRIPSANYSLSIALQENALRVMCLPRGTPRSASGEPGLLPRRPAHQPGESHQGCHAEAHSASDLAAEDFPRPAVCTAGSAKVCCCPERPPFEAGWWYFREFLEKPPAHRR